MDAGSVYVILGTTTTSAAPTPALSWVGQPVPNPFSSTVRLDYTLEETADVRVEIYDVTGRRVLDIDLPRQDVGDHRFEWLGRGKEDTELPSGVYFCRVTAGNVVQSRKFVLLR
jgi:flagellar hook assembly protein FlgD